MKAEFVEQDPGFKHASTDHHGTSSSSSSTSALSRLKLYLPILSGDMLDWREFWKILSACIECEMDLEDYEKLIIWKWLSFLRTTMRFW